MAAKDFNLLRFQECSEALVPMLKRNKREVFFWCFAIVSMFFMLGSYPAQRSEARWFEIVREMLLTGDWLHPCINGGAYFDKPLVSYWLIAVLAKLSGGIVNEFVCRAPSVISALIGLVCVRNLTALLTNGSRRAALLAGWLTLSLYSFMLWGRLAEADMEQTVFILGAVTVYMNYRDRKSWGAYIGFWFLCAVGAQTKGLPALVIPPMLAFIDCIIRKQIKFHLNLKFFVAFAIGMIVYFIPFILSFAGAGNYSADGLMLVFRENIVRVFNPWDHNDDPFYCYFGYLPRLLIPWSLFFVMAFADRIIQGVRKRHMEENDLWLLCSVIAIFVLFSVSRSRRVYYILPIVPYCMIQTAIWLERQEKTALQKISTFLFNFAHFILPMVAIVLAFAVFAFPSVMKAYFNESGCMDFVPAEVLFNDFSGRFMLICLIATLFGLGYFVFWLIAFRRIKKGNGFDFFTVGKHPVNVVVPFVCMVGSLVFAVVIPLISSSRLFNPCPAFLREVGQTVQANCTADPDYLNRVVIFGDFGEAAVVYYMNLQKPIRKFALEELNDENRDFFDDTVNILGYDAFKTALTEIREKGGMVITHANEAVEIPDDEIRCLFLNGTANYADGVLVEDFNPVTELKISKLAANPEKREKYEKAEGKRLIILVVSPHNHETKDSDNV